MEGSNVSPDEPEEEPSYGIAPKQPPPPVGAASALSRNAVRALVAYAVLGGLFTVGYFTFKTFGG